MRSSVAVFAAFGLLVSLAMPAQASEDPPGRVARISYIQGDVSIQPADSDDWTWASLNRPLTSGASLYTKDRARTELDIGSAAVRVGAETDVSLLNLDDSSAQIGLNSGTAIFHVRHIPQGGFFEVDTPNAAVTLLQPGDYRISTSEAGDATSVDVRAGKAEVTGNNVAFRVSGGTEAQLAGTNELHYDYYDLPPSDDFDRWSRMRDFRHSHVRSARYVPSDLPGVEDLDTGGQWVEVPTYGQVWQPLHVDADWTPYRHGHWAWIHPWGWSWIDDAPWGFTTCHYGRWAHADRGWFWVPPRREATVIPVYSPANVVFLSGGGPAREEVVAWAPLAPGEVYYPSYHYSGDYLTRLNGTNTFVRGPIHERREREEITPRAFTNALVAGAVIAVGADVFASSRHVDRAAVRIDASALASKQVVATAPVAPIKASVLAASTDKPAAEAPKPPQQVVSRQLIAKTAPPPKPVPFEKKQSLLEQNKGKPIDPEQEKSLQAKTAAPATAVRTVSAPAPAAENREPVKKHRPADMRGYGLIKPAGTAPSSEATGAQLPQETPSNTQGAPANTQENPQSLREEKKQQREEELQQRDEARKQQEQKRAIDNQQRAEERQKQEDAKKQEEQQRVEEKQQADQKRVEERQKQEDAKKQEEQQRLEAKQQEQQQRAEERQKQEDAKKQEEQQRVEEKQQADQQRAEERQKQEDAKKQEEQQRVEEKQQADQQRAEERQKQEDAKKQEEQQRVEEKQQADQQRAEERQKQEDAKKQEEQQRADQKAEEKTSPDAGKSTQEKRKEKQKQKDEKKALESDDKGNVQTEEQVQ